ncbi:MAG: branched-chain amino acid transport system ATP-binding protein [Halobacteriales archaeon]
MPESVLEVENLTKSFDATVANDGITLSIERGECHGIIGPNGSGKTTFFNLLTGFYTPDAGTVRFDGEDITGLSPDGIAEQGLVRTFQIVSPFENMTVRENLLSVYTEGLRSGLRVPTAKRRRADQVLKLLDLDQVADHEASDVSGGQQKLLDLGRAMMLEPKCILLDEPTAGVNPGIQEQILRTLAGLNQGDVTIVVIEHDMSVIGDVADRISVFNRGQVLAQGDFSSVTADRRVRDAYIGRDSEPGAEVADVIPDADEDAGDARAAGGDGHGHGDAPATGATAAVEAGGETERPSTAVPETAGTTERDAREDVDRLVAEDVVTGYGNQVVLDGVSVRTRDGITCLFGPNGSGKSTLLKAIAGTVPVWSGTVRYGDRTITGAEPHEIVEAGISTVPQHDHVFTGLTVRENLQLGATRVDDDALVRERMDRVLDTFPALEGSLSAKARSLSGGQQVMLGFGRAMMTGADVYLLDEPVSGLAPSMIDEVFDTIRNLVDQGAQVVLIEQNVGEALAVADHVYVLAGGEIRFDGPPADLRDEDEIVDLYLGLD